MRLWPQRRSSAAAEPSLERMLDWFNFQNATYPVLPSFSYDQKGEEAIDPSFVGYTQQMLKDNGVVFACMAVRLLLFQEARFQFRQYRKGKPGDLFGTEELRLLELPAPNQTTRDLLARMIQDADLAGNAYLTVRNGQVRRMRPDWVSIVFGTGGDDENVDSLDATLLGYLYHPGGKYSGKDPVPLRPAEVAHFNPMPDPAATYRGMSWLAPVVREVTADSAATTHKLKFFENAATPNLAIKLDPTVKMDAFNEWVRYFREHHEGAGNAYKAMILGAGADFTVVGADLRQMDFKLTQGAGETRIAAAAGTPPILVGLSEGLQSATYSNYQLAMRRFADLTMRPLWGAAAAALSTLVEEPPGSRLEYDARNIPALAESEADIADIRQKNAATIRTLIDGGFEPDSVIAAVVADDFDLLVHTGLFSVQTQPPPGMPGSPTALAPAPNGSQPANGNGENGQPQPNGRPAVPAPA